MGRQLRKLWEGRTKDYRRKNEAKQGTLKVEMEKGEGGETERKTHKTNHYKMTKASVEEPIV
jgi:hypothetical protein